MKNDLYIVTSVLPSLSGHHVLHMEEWMLESPQLQGHLCLDRPLRLQGPGHALKFFLSVTLPPPVANPALRPELDSTPSPGGAPFPPLLQERSQYRARPRRAQY